MSWRAGTLDPAPGHWIGNATFADLVVVWARDEEDNQIKAFVVEKGTPGFTSSGR
ncbi:hypothetical protein GCM10012275_06640 [Longimycelium tulufanense]|uniref:Uncharacterized protein n=1 Tax=Longimycelium tulufanense TaxID=907463 RepID=A0A8J3C6D0_9PSEU|nr:hypothetical protein [Longimycelium tulufanense]GGM38306.1 hypothetical protein GCM10012275_06640 [Longimycelium tulufanense]